MIKPMQAVKAYRYTHNKDSLRVMLLSIATTGYIRQAFHANEKSDKHLNILVLR